MEVLGGRERTKLCNYILINFLKDSLSSDALFHMWFNLLHMSSQRINDRKLVTQVPALQTLPQVLPTIFGIDHTFS